MILYRLLLTLIFPMMLFQAFRQGGVFERLGGGGPANKVGLWLHGASVGELTSAKALIKALADQGDGPVLVTCNTLSAKRMADSWAMEGVTVRLAPFDLRWCLKRFLRQHQPRALILVESELWPNRMEMMAGRLAIVGARVSEGTAAAWGRRASGLMARMLSGVVCLSAQDEASAARFVRLGLPADRLLAPIMLKTTVPLQDRPLPFAAPCARHQCLLAASTHEGDEALVLAAWPAAQAAGFQTLILAPRHPERAETVARLAPMGRRSQGDVATEGIYLADSLGEMDYWYRMAGVTIIGGTFSNRGGHTPYEPVAYGSALVHGPDFANFAESFALLEKAGGALTTEPAGLAALLTGLDATRQDELARAAHSALGGRQDLGPLLKALADALP